MWRICACLRWKESALVCSRKKKCSSSQTTHLAALQLWSILRPSSQSLMTEGLINRHYTSLKCNSHPAETNPRKTAQEKVSIQHPSTVQLTCFAFGTLKPSLILWRLNLIPPASSHTPTDPSHLVSPQEVTVYSSGNNSYTYLCPHGYITTFLLYKSHIDAHLKQINKFTSSSRRWPY